MTSKIEFFTEVPTAYLDKLTDVIDGHFCIATECLKDPEYYAWYKNRPRNVEVMLDNGMFEEGKPLSPAQLFDIASEIRPNIVFAPDQVGNRVKTFKMTYEFIEMCEKYHVSWNVGVIPQGESPQDIVLCHNDMIQHLDFAGPIGISFLNNRENVCNILTCNDFWSDYHKYHFLGLYNVDEIRTWPARIASMDSIKPFKAAMHGHLVEDCPRGLGKWNTQITVDDEALMYRNIAVMHKALSRRLV